MTSPPQRREFEQTLGEWRGKPDVLQSVWSQRLRGDFVTEQQKLLKHLSQCGRPWPIL